MSVNVSVRQLQHPGFLGDVQKALTAGELEPGALVLEITEGVVIRDPDAAGRPSRRFGVSAWDSRSTTSEPATRRSRCSRRFPSTR